MIVAAPEMLRAGRATAQTLFLRDKTVSDALWDDALSRIYSSMSRAAQCKESVR